MSTLGISSTLGVLFLALLLATSLWGASNLQLIRYFRLRFHEDRFVKILVVVIWLVDTTHQVLVAQALYQYLVSGFGNLSSLMSTSQPLALQYVFQGITTFAVQSFYIYRVWMLRQKRPVLPALIIPFSIASLVMAIYAGQYQYGLTTIASQAGWFDNLLIPLLAATTFVTDVLIAAFLYYCLCSDKSDWASTQSVIDQLVLSALCVSVHRSNVQKVVYCIGTGAFTSLCALATLLAAVLARGSPVYLIFFMASGRLYMNSMLASLNARKALRRMQAAPHSEPLVFLRSLPSDSAHQHEAGIDLEVGVLDSQTTMYNANVVRKST